MCQNPRCRPQSALTDATGHRETSSTFPCLWADASEPNFWPKFWAKKQNEMGQKIQKHSNASNSVAKIGYNICRNIM